MTYEQAIEQLQAEIAAKGKFSFNNTADYLAGLAAANKTELQAMLDKLLAQKGVITEADQESVNAILEKQKDARKQRTKIIIKDVAIGLGTLVLGTAFWFTLRKRKK